MTVDHLNGKNGFVTPAALERARGVIKDEAAQEAANRQHIIDEHEAQLAAEAQKKAQWIEEGRAQAQKEIAAAQRKAAEEEAKRRQAAEQAAVKAKADRRQATDDLLNLEVNLAEAFGRFSQHSVEAASTTTDRDAALVAAGEAKAQAAYTSGDIHLVAARSGDPDILEHYKLRRPDQPANTPAPDGFVLRVVPDEPAQKAKVEPAPVPAPRRKIFGR